jgi:hypothetical protein
MPLHQPHPSRFRSRADRAGRVYIPVWLAVLVLIIVGVGLWLFFRSRNTPPSAPPTTAQSTTAKPPAPLRGTGGFPLVPVKPPPVSPGFQGCPPQGDGGDAALNVLKNRADSAAWIPVPFTSVVNLEWPRAVAQRQRARWTARELAQVKRYEGTPVSVEGYLAAAKSEGPESPNCHGADAAFRDWHVWLAPTPGTDRRQSIVVETTPTLRAMHPEWSLAALRAVSRAGMPVRISGWTLLDQEHPEQIGRTRGTIWEIHPIMRIEVKQGGQWVDIGNAVIPSSRSRRSR